MSRSGARPPIRRSTAVAIYGSSSSASALRMIRFSPWRASVSVTMRPSAASLTVAVTTISCSGRPMPRNWTASRFERPRVAVGERAVGARDLGHRLEAVQDARRAGRPTSRTPRRCGSGWGRRTPRRSASSGRRPASLAARGSCRRASSSAIVSLPQTPRTMLVQVAAHGLARRPGWSRPTRRRRSPCRRARRSPCRSTRVVIVVAGADRLAPDELLAAVDHGGDVHPDLGVEDRRSPSPANCRRRRTSAARRRRESPPPRAASASRWTALGSPTASAYFVIRSASTSNEAGSQDLPIASVFSAIARGSLFSETAASAAFAVGGRGGSGRRAPSRISNR